MRARLLGGERFYSRKELDGWIAGDTGEPTLLRQKIDQMFAANEAAASETDLIILDALRKAGEPCSALVLAAVVVSARGKDIATGGVARTEEKAVRARLRCLLDRGLVRRVAAASNRHVMWEIA